MGPVRYTTAFLGYNLAPENKYASSIFDQKELGIPRVWIYFAVTRYAFLPSKKKWLDSDLVSYPTWPIWIYNRVVPDDTAHIQKLAVAGNWYYKWPDREAEKYVLKDGLFPNLRLFTGLGESDHLQSLLSVLNCMLY
jgi:hypothetical protein